jgi:streptogramin lyase
VRRLIHRLLLVSLVGLLTAVLVPSTVSAAITEFPLPTAGPPPFGNLPATITTGPDGALWFNETGSGNIGRITTAGSFTEFPAQGGALQGITAGPDGALWFTDFYNNQIGRITTSGSITKFGSSLASPPDRPRLITVGPDGALWFTNLGDEIDRITTSGSFTRFSSPEADGITAGPDGALWVTMGGAIGRITTQGRITYFAVPAADSDTNPSAGEITAGPDGALWFTEVDAAKTVSGKTSYGIGRITTGGSFSEFPITTPGVVPRSITAGPDGALWFTDSGTHMIDRMTTSGSFSEFPGLPGLTGAPQEITTGPDGALWFTEPEANLIGRITTSGVPTGRLEVKDATVPSSDPGRFDLQIDGVTKKADAADGDDTGKKTVLAGGHKVGEEGGSFTLPSDYTSRIVCKDGGGSGATIASSSSPEPLNVAIVPGADVVCTITNTRKLETRQLREFALPTANSQPQGITAGPDGALWFTEFLRNKIGRVTTAGSISEFSIPAAGTGITAGPDGALWFTESGSNKIGRITTSGSVSEVSVPTANSQPLGITSGPDGALWFTESGSNKIGRITTSGSVSEVSVPTAAGGPWGITAGPDGALWFTELSARKIGRITTSGNTSEFQIPLEFGQFGPLDITAGPDGALWFSEFDRIGRITTGGSFSQFPLPTAGSYPGGLSPGGIAAGPDGAVWFTEQGSNKIGRIPTGAIPTGTLEIKKVLSPASDAGRFNLQIDGQTAMANAGDGDATGKQTVSATAHTVGETAGSATSLSDYTSAIACKNQTGVTIASSSNAGPLSVNVAQSADVVCTITNTRKPPPTSSSGGGYSSSSPRAISPPILPPFAGVALASQTATVAKNRKLQLLLSCPAITIGSCAGTDTLKTRGPVAAKAAKHKKRKKRVLKLGSARFSISAGNTGKVTIKLSKVAFKLLAKKHTLKVLEVAVAHDSGGTPKTSTARITLKARKK